MKAYYSSEAAEQKVVIRYCDIKGIPIVHIPNEGKRSARAGAIREFAERVRAETCDAHPLLLEFVREVVDSIEQEMTEERK